VASFNINLRSSVNRLKSINLIIRYSGVSFAYSTGYKIESKDWNLNTQRPKNDESLSLILDTYIVEAKNIYIQYKSLNNLKEPSKVEMKELLNKRFKPSKIGTSKGSLQQFIKQFVKESYSRIHKGRELHHNTIKQYERVGVTIAKYGKSIGTTIDFKDIDIEFYKGYTKYLKQKHKLSINTIGKYIASLKTIMFEAVDMKLTTNMAFTTRKFQVNREKSENIYLTKDELQSIYELELEHDYLDNTRDWFLIGCYTGLRYSDLINLNYDDIIDDCIEVTAKKTGKTSLVPFNHPIVKAILKKNNGLPRPISNQRCNKYIKEVCSRVERLNISVFKRSSKGGELKTREYKKYELVCTHTMRRSFISNLILDGIPIHAIMSITAHSTEAMLLSYVKVKPRESISKVFNHFNRTDTTT
jgi:integrase